MAALQTLEPYLRSSGQSRPLTPYPGHAGRLAPGSNSCSRQTSARLGAVTSRRPILAPILATILALAFASLAGSPAAACSMNSGYRPPTNFELAAEADTIVLGTVKRMEEEEGLFSRGTIVVQPTLLLKGEVLPAEIRMNGGGLRRGHSVVRSDPLELFKPNPHALSGTCGRWVFEPGMQLVLFLQRDSKGGLQPSNPPDSRAAEDVPGPDAPWVKTIRLYARVSALPAERRRAALVAQRDALLSSGEADAALLAAEIDRQLEEGIAPRNREEGLFTEPALVPLFGGKPARIPR